MNSRSFVAPAAALLLLAALPARASETVYTSRTAFNNASVNLTTFTFQGLVTSGTATKYPNPAGLTTGGLNFKSSSDQLFAIDPSHPPGSFNFPQGQYLNNNDYSGNSVLNITLLPANTTAIGGDWGLQTAQNITQFQLTLTLSNSDTIQATLPASTTSPVLTFRGFTSTVPITSISVSGIGIGNSGSLVLDNFSFGQVAPVPEPATWMVSALTIGGTALLGRRRRAQVR